MNDPCDRCDGKWTDCHGCSHVREWLEEQREDNKKCEKPHCPTCDDMTYVMHWEDGITGSIPCPDCQQSDKDDNVMRETGRKEIESYVDAYSMPPRRVCIESEVRELESICNKQAEEIEKMKCCGNCEKQELTTDCRDCSRHKINSLYTGLKDNWKQRSK